MATKPTRQQQQARDLLAEALHGITEAYRLDGHGKLDPGDLDEMRDGSVGSLGVRSRSDRARSDRTEGKSPQALVSAVDLIALSADELKPLQTLLLSDSEFQELVQKLEEELGGM